MDLAASVIVALRPGGRRADDSGAEEACPGHAQRAKKPAMAVAHKAAPAAPQAAAPIPDLTKQYCIGCHSEKGHAGGLSLVSFDPVEGGSDTPSRREGHPKLRLGMMPPPGARRPDAAVLSQFASSLENKIDAAALAIRIRAAGRSSV